MEGRKKEGKLRNDLDKESAEATIPPTGSRVACISPPSPFVDVIRHNRSLSTMFQIPDPDEQPRFFRCC